METKKIFILGVGHNTPVFMNLALDCGYEIDGLYHYNDSRTGQFEHGYSILGSFNDLFKKENLTGMNFLLSMGDNKIRTALCSQIVAKGGNVHTLIHPSAVISRFTEISNTGVIISPFVYVQADSKIGANTIILSGVNISHNNLIGANCFIAGGSTIGAYTQVADFVFVGQGVLTISDKVKHIGQGAYIGAGALITTDVPQDTMVAGRPAKSIKKFVTDRWVKIG